MSCIHSFADLCFKSALMGNNEVVCGYNYIFLQSVSSTNLFAGDLVRSASESQKYFIRAGYQTHGMGQGGSGWESDANMNILVSIVLKPSGILPENQFFITQAVSVGIMSAVGKIIDRNKLAVKWPNDIYYDENKLAGMLISNIISGSDLQWTIIGIGLNVNQTVFPTHVPRPVSLSLITGQVHDIEGLAHEMLCAIDQNLAQISLPAGTEKMEQAYHQSLFRLNKWADFSIGGEVKRAKILGVAPYGLLQIETESGEVESFGFKQIEFL